MISSGNFEKTFPWYFLWRAMQCVRPFGVESGRKLPRHLITGLLVTLSFVIQSVVIRRFEAQWPQKAEPLRSQIEVLGGEVFSG